MEGEDERKWYDVSLVSVHMCVCVCVSVLLAIFLLTDI